VGDGCGSKFEVEVESPQFEGKALLARHRLVRSLRCAFHRNTPR
jgi:stress-induced morphogen